MAEFKYLIHFADEKGDRFFADIDSTEPAIGAQINAHRSFEDLKEKKNGTLTTIAKVRLAGKSDLYVGMKAHIDSSSSLRSLHTICLSIASGLIIRATQRKQV